MRYRTLVAGLAVVGLATGIRLMVSPSGSSPAAMAQRFEQHKLAFLRQQANKANHDTHIPRDHPVGAVDTAPQTSSPSEIREPAPYPFVAATIHQTTAWMWGRYPGTSVQDLQSQVLVVSGSVPNHPLAGEIGVWVFNVGSVPWQGQFVAPGHTGAIAIKNFHGHVATWTSSSGQHGTFDIVTHTWSIRPRNITERT